MLKLLRREWFARGYRKTFGILMLERHHFTLLLSWRCWNYINLLYRLAYFARGSTYQRFTLSCLVDIVLFLLSSLNSFWNDSWVIAGINPLNFSGECVFAVESSNVILHRLLILAEHATNVAFKQVI